MGIFQLFRSLKSWDLKGGHKFKNMNQSSKNIINTSQLFPQWPEYKTEDVICNCMSIKRNEILSLVKKTTNIDDLVSCTGAGSVCTGCHPLLHETMGAKIWTAVELVSIEQVSDITKSYRFKSLEKPFEKAESGQHILFQAHINGSWVLRRYTLTTPAGETDYREIMVQKEPGGIVSNWLFNLKKPSNSENDKYHIRISEPTGNIKFNLSKKRPLICFVGSIGVTPAVSAIRSLQPRSKSPTPINLLKRQPKKTKSRKILIDYSVQNESRLVNVDQFHPSRTIREDHNYDESIGSSVNSDINTNAHVNIRLADKDGFINQTHINEIVKSHSKAEYFVCGPTPFISAVTEYLHVAKVAKKHVKVELFSLPDAKKVKQSKGYLYLGLLLLAAFFLQDHFQLKIQWLETLQLNDNYKIYSGLGLLLYLILQFVMPYNRSCEIPHAAADCYNLHKIRGVFIPLVYYFHSTQMGNEYLFVLSSVLLGNLLIGLLNHELISDPVRRVRYFSLWLPLHIILSILLVALTAFHIFIVTSY